MLDPVLVREQPALVETRLRSRGLDPSKELAAVAALESERRRLIPLVENLKREQNALSDAVAKAKREGRDATPLFAESRTRAAEIREHEVALAAIDQQRDALLLTIPNLPHESVPVGRSADDNLEIR